MQLVWVTPDQLRRAWPLVAPLLTAAMRRSGGGAIGPVHDDVMAGRALLWLACDGHAVAAAAVTELGTAAGRRTCTIVACGGHGRGRWLHLIAGLEAHARENGCAGMRIEGRRGWRRLLPDYRVIGAIAGRPRAVVLEKDL